MTIEKLQRNSVLHASFAACLALGLAACGSEDDGNGDGAMDGVPDDGADDGMDGTSPGDGSDGGDGGDGTGDGGDGTGGDDGGDGGGGPVECPTPATGEHDGHVQLQGDNPDTSVLDGVRKITGELIIDSTNLTNLDFLACVEEVGGGINIFDNNSLVDLGGLAGITTITDFSAELTIAENDSLVTIAGFGKLGSVGSLSINNNASLQNVDGPSALEAINQNLTIRYNDSLTNLNGLSNLKAVGSKFNVVGNPMLPCGNIAKLGDQLQQLPQDAIWCEGNLNCEAIPACQG